MKELKGFRGRNALVTGAGDGIGAMLAKKLAEAGMTVCVQDIRQEAAERVASEIGAASFALGGDVSDRDSLAKAANELRSRDFPINLLWLNAGVGVGSPVLQGRTNAIEWGFSVNVLGIIWSMQAFYPLLEQADGPKHVGFTASSASIVPTDGDFPLYALSKHGTFAVAETLASELQDESISSTILCPGLLNTNIWDGAKARPERFGGVRHMDPAISSQWTEAQHPDVLWPHIAENINKGGGYLVCPTDPDLQVRFEERHDAIRKSFRPIYD